jgi:hypothetical protein
MRWAKLGDENTKFFHTVATQSYRRNYITSIKDDDGNYITNHDHKVAIIWNSYKNRLGITNLQKRLGITNNPVMSFDLDHLVTRYELSHLDDPFTMDEISTVLKEIPLDKSPGPDGFSGLFMKKSWDIIKNDFIKLANDFYSGNMNLASINTAYITLIPKVNNPETMNEFRPISLVSMPLKFITKLLANRLQKEIIHMLHQNQYGFIKGKTIHDCLGWAFEYLHLCHISKKPIIIMKIDFEQAFDKVEFNAIIAMCKVLGIGPRFLSWITNILHTTSTSVLLNGIPGKKIFCRRGVRQGDPLSPLLFVATAELLQYIINQAWHNGELQLPLDNDYGQNFPIIQYADDTLLIMHADIDQLQHLKSLLVQFSDATGSQGKFH